MSLNPLNPIMVYGDTLTMTAFDVDRCCRLLWGVWGIRADEKQETHRGEAIKVRCSMCSERGIYITEEQLI